MSLPSEYNKALHSKANFYAAWFPVAMPFRVGDYGLVSNGVFQKTGNLDDLRNLGFTTKVRVAKGPPTSIDFMSKGAKVVNVVAGAEVPQLPAAHVEAELRYEFEKKNSFVVKAALLTVEQMENIGQVAEELARLRRQNKWSHRYRVVSATYTGDSCLVILASEAHTKVEFTAAASALKALNLGEIKVVPAVKFSSETILSSIGKTGVLGLGLFKLSWVGGNLKVLADSALSAEEQEVEDDWGDALKNDL